MAEQCQFGNRCAVLSETPHSPTLSEIVPSGEIQDAKHTELSDREPEVQRGIRELMYDDGLLSELLLLCRSALDST